MQQLVECVPNFSDGRNPEVYNGIANVIRSVSGVNVLDVSADPDHNRTVITFVGSPTAAEEAAFRAIALAAKRINLDEHEGEHPRIGATDVCPFIPIKNITSQECVALAQRLGRRVGEELGIAVYLYGDAATRPNRKKLSAIRKGQYELWKEEVATNPERQPDYGPAEAKPWGATEIGVRPFLIAYNLYLNSNNTAVANRIARAVRFSSGGLRFVQAKGFLVEGQAQVSMNLTNFEKTPLYRVQEMVKREAAQYGLSVTKAELVGLIPQKALMETAKWYLQLDEMQDEQVLEYRLADNESEAGPSLADFVTSVADDTPTPGGGSVAALAGSLGAALAQMVAGLTLGRQKYANVQTAAEGIKTQAEALRQQLKAAITEDAAAFEALMAAFRNKELDKEAKTAAIEAATVGAGEVPRHVARLSRDVAQLAQDIAAIGNVNAATDAAVAALMANAAVQAAALNVRVNAVGLNDQDLAAQWRSEVEALQVETAALTEQTLVTAAERGGY